MRPDLHAGDRESIEAILSATGAFTGGEIQVALELVDLALAGSREYDFLVASGPDDRLWGYACHGWAPLAERVHEIYWIAVDPAVQGCGVGTALIAAVEAAAAQAAARMLLIETASKPSYHGTRAFYLRNGYAEWSRIADFYAEGDDRVVYGKRLRPAA